MRNAWKWVGLGVVALVACESTKGGGGGGGKSTLDADALCEQACDCQGCSDAQKEECVNEIEQLESKAQDEGCDSELEAYGGCIDGNMQCNNGELEVPGDCVDEVQDLADCMNSSSGAGGEGGSGGASVTSSMSSSGTPSSSSSTSSSAMSSSSGGPVGCDTMGTCDACSQCAIEGNCSDELANCQNNADCIELFTCIEPCVDQACIDNCANMYPNGIAAANALGECVTCFECPITCDAAGSGC